MNKRLYWVWADMRRRCSSPRHKAFPNYGGRGITVCDRWHLYSNFAADMGEPEPGMTLDREDNDGNYEPGNCRWVSRAVQNRNRRNCIYVGEGAEKVTLKEYCRAHGLPYRAIAKRIQDRGWPLDKALTAPPRTRLRAAA